MIINHAGDLVATTHSNSNSVYIPPRARSEAGTGGSADDANAVLAASSVSASDAANVILIQELLRAIEGWRHADADSGRHRDREEVQRERWELQEM